MLLRQPLPQADDDPTLTAHIPNPKTNFAPLHMTLQLNIPEELRGEALVAVPFIQIKVAVHDSKTGRDFAIPSRWYIEPFEENPDPDVHADHPAMFRVHPDGYVTVTTVKRSPFQGKDARGNPVVQRAVVVMRNPAGFKQFLSEYLDPGVSYRAANRQNEMGQEREHVIQVFLIDDYGRVTPAERLPEPPIAVDQFLRLRQRFLPKEDVGENESGGPPAAGQEEQPTVWKDWPGAVHPRDMAVVSVAVIRAMEDLMGAGTFEMDISLEDILGRFDEMRRAGQLPDIFYKIDSGAADRILQAIPEILGRGQTQAGRALYLMAASTLIAQSVAQGGGVIHANMQPQATTRNITDLVNAKAQATDMLGSKLTSFDSILSPDLQSDIARRTFSFLTTGSAAGQEEGLRRVLIVACTTRDGQVYEEMTSEWLRDHGRSGIRVDYVTNTGPAFASAWKKTGPYDAIILLDLDFHSGAEAPQGVTLIDAMQVGISEDVLIGVYAPNVGRHERILQARFNDDRLFLFEPREALPRSRGHHDAFEDRVLTETILPSLNRQFRNSVVPQPHFRSVSRTPHSTGLEEGDEELTNEMVNLSRNPYSDVRKDILENHPSSMKIYLYENATAKSPAEVLDGADIDEERGGELDLAMQRVYGDNIFISGRYSMVILAPPEDPDGELFFPMKRPDQWAEAPKRVEIRQVKQPTSGLEEVRLTLPFQAAIVTLEVGEHEVGLDAVLEGKGFLRQGHGTLGGPTLYVRDSLARTVIAKKDFLESKLRDGGPDRLAGFLQDRLASLEQQRTGSISTGGISVPIKIGQVVLLFPERIVIDLLRSAQDTPLSLQAVQEQAVILTILDRDLRSEPRTVTFSVSLGWTDANHPVELEIGGQLVREGPVALDKKSQRIALIPVLPSVQESDGFTEFHRRLADHVTQTNEIPFLIHVDGAGAIEAVDWVGAGRPEQVLPSVVDRPGLPGAPADYRLLAYDIAEGGLFVDVRHGRFFELKPDRKATLLLGPGFGADPAKSAKAIREFFNAVDDAGGIASASLIADDERGLSSIQFDLGDEQMFQITTAEDCSLISDNDILSSGLEEGDERAMRAAAAEMIRQSTLQAVTSGAIAAAQEMIRQSNPQGATGGGMVASAEMTRRQVLHAATVGGMAAAVAQQPWWQDRVFGRDQTIQADPFLEQYGGQLTEQQRVEIQAAGEVTPVIPGRFTLFADPSLRLAAGRAIYRHLRQRPAKGMDFVVHKEDLRDLLSNRPSLIRPPGLGAYDWMLVAPAGSVDGVRMQAFSIQEMEALHPLAWVVLNINKNLTVRQLLNLRFVTVEDEQGQLIHAVYA